MSLDKIKSGLGASIKKEESSPFDSEAMGEYLRQRLKTSQTVFPPHSITRFAKEKKEEEPKENPEV